MELSGWKRYLPPPKEVLSPPVHWFVCQQKNHRTDFHQTLGRGDIGQERPYLNLVCVLKGNYFSFSLLLGRKEDFCDIFMNFPRNSEWILMGKKLDWLEGDWWNMVEVCAHSSDGSFVLFYKKCMVVTRLHVHTQKGHSHATDSEWPVRKCFDSWLIPILSLCSFMSRYVEFDSCYCFTVTIQV